MVDISNDCFHVMGSPDRYGRLSHVASFLTVDAAVAFGKTVDGGTVLPGSKVGIDMHYTAVDRMQTAIRAASRRQ